MKFVRFTLLRKHAHTDVEAGILHEAYRLAQSASLSSSTQESLNNLLKWFEENLAIPPRFNRSTSKGYYRRATRGVSWFKPTATEHIGRMRELAIIFEEAGFIVQEIAIARPGYLIYEDEYQIVAEPFRDVIAKRSN
jgi:hypothetical protein